MGTRTGQTKQVHDNARGRINDIGGFPCNTVRCDYIFCHIMDLCYTYCISYKCWNLSIALQFPDHPFEDKESREGIINSHPFHFGCTQPDVNPPTLISRLLVPLPVNRHLRFIGSYAQSSSDRLYLSHLPSDSGVTYIAEFYLWIYLPNKLELRTWLDLKEEIDPHEKRSFHELEMETQNKFLLDISGSYHLGASSSS